jgi:hypothetical protein
MNTTPLPIKRNHRRAATILTLAGIFGIVISITDIHRTLFGIAWNFFLPIFDSLTGWTA